MNTIRHTLDALSTINMQSLRYELDTLEAIRTWAMEQLGIDYQPGDRVTITDPTPSEVTRDNGWYAFREALAPGQTGIAGDITFSTTRKRWYVTVGMDRAWAVDEHNDFTKTVTRYWHGPAADTPAGYEPPSPYDQKRHPNGETIHFHMDVTWLAKVPEPSTP